MVIYFDSQHEMYCNEKRKKIVILILLMTMMDTQIVASKQQQISKIRMATQHDDGTSGDLYNIFKKRLLAIQKELAYHKFNNLEQLSTKIQEKRSPDESVRQERIYESFYNKKLKQQQLRYSNLTNNHLVSSISSKSKNGKRSPVRSEFYELYSKKMDNLNNHSPLDSEKVDRSGRSFFNWFRKESKNKENIKKNFSPNQPNTSKSNNPQLSEQLLNMTKTIDVDNVNFTKLLDILKQESNFTNSIAMRDTLNREFLKQMEMVNNVMTPIEKRFYRQAMYQNKHYNSYDQNWLQDDNYNNIDWDFDNQNKDYEFWSLLPKKSTSLNHSRRQIRTNNANASSLDNYSAYPSVLTKAVEISLNPSVHSNSSGSLLAKVAQKMNTSTLDLAEKLAKSTDSPNDGHLAKMLHNFMPNDDQPSNCAKGSEIMNNNLVSPQSVVDQISTAKGYKPIVLQEATTSSPVQTGTSENIQAYSKNEETPNGLSTSRLTTILDRVLSKLERIHDGKNGDDEEHPDGAPCDIIGSWSSITLGLCFNIKSNKEKIRDVSPAEVNNKMLLIEAQECTPQRSHQIVDLEWKFGGSALKTMGGPFYIYAQKRSESLVGTFLGYCRTCASIDTIFGSWTFSSPSKNYYDISLAFDIKRDLLRRDRMEIKRKDRFKDLLYQTRPGKSENH